METGSPIAAPGQAQPLNFYIEQFLFFLAEEEFEAGRNWARKLVSEKTADGLFIHADETPYQSLDRSENEFAYELPPALPDMREDLAFLMYAANYFSGRYKIEQSYRYRHAHKLIENSLRFLEMSEQNANARLLPILKQFSSLQDHMSQVERACYNSDDTVYEDGKTLMQAGAVSLLNAVRAVRSQEAGLSAYERGLYDRYLEPRLDAHAIYAEALLQLAALNHQRWADRESFLLNAVPVINDLQTKRAQLSKLGASILENDLAPQIETLKAFAALPLTAEQSGELTVRAGKIEISYYALVRPDLVDTIDRIVRQQSLELQSDIFSFSQLRASKVEDDPLSDIWAWDGGANEKLIDSVSWQLPGVEVIFRQNPIRFASTLRYYNFGVFSLSLRAELSDRSASEVRHIASLGSPIALDEEILWAELGKTFGTLEDLAKFVLPIVEAEIRRALSGSSVPIPDDAAEKSEAPLSYSAIMNRFAALRIDKLALKDQASGYHALSPADAVRHPNFKAFTLPAIEARCATDDWIMRRPPDASENLAPLRYYQEGDAIYLRRHDGVLALLNQANWARDQAWEGMILSAAITNFFCITNSLFNRRVRDFVSASDRGGNSSKSAISTLRDKLRRTEANLLSIQRFEHEVEGMLDTMEAGRVMRFPDLTLLINRMFEQLGLPHLTSQTRLLLSQAREMLSQTQEELKTKRADQLNFIAKIIGALVAIAQIQPLMVLSKDLGYEIPPFGQLGIYLSLLIFVSWLLISGRQRHER